MKTKLPCETVDPEVFFPVGNSGPALAQADQAKTFCRRCPITQECLQWALDMGEVGVWGGTDDEERRALRRGHYLLRRKGESRLPMVRQLASA